MEWVTILNFFNSLLSTLKSVSEVPIKKWLSIIIFLILGFILGAYIEGKNALKSGKYVITEIIDKDLVDAHRKSEGLRSSALTLLATWNAIVLEKNKNNNIKFPKSLKNGFRNIYITSRDKGNETLIDNLSYKKQYTYYYYSTSVTVALANIIGKETTGHEDDIDFIEEALKSTSHLIRFTEDFKDKIGLKWISNRDVKERNNYLRAEALCIQAIQGGYDKKRVNDIKDEISKIVTINLSADYREIHGINADHPIIGLCINDSLETIETKNSSSSKTDPA